MFDFLKQKGNNHPQDVKTLRHSLLQFIKEQLQKWQGGEGNAIKGFQLFMAPAHEEKHLYEAAIYMDEEGRFKNEVQKIADDYAIALPDAWTMETAFVDLLPKEAIQVEGLEAAIYVSTRKQPALNQATTAYINIVNGAAERDQYTLTATSGKINIGREKKVQTTEGFFRVNTISFPNDGSHESNKYISREHAHIEWNSEAGCFFLFADEGGIPPRNKIKVKTAGGALIKLQAAHIGHALQEGDQIILGESALLEFSYSNAVI